MDFDEWYARVAKQYGIAPNPDDPEHYYDYRKLFQEMQQGKYEDPISPGGHFPSEFKTEGHPRSYLDDSEGHIFDTRTSKYMDGTPVPPKLLEASEQSPDMPGFDPKMAAAVVNAFMRLGGIK